MNRRTFLKTAGAAAVAPLIVPSSAFGADGHTAPSNRISVGCIGVGPRGTEVMRGFLPKPHARIVAVCDVNRRRVEDTKKLVDAYYGDSGCAMYGDYRELLARDDIDAVLIASTDHWHVLHALEAAHNRKDMYVEKPLGLSLAEDQALRDACDTYGCVFQFGTQQRSASNFRFACELVRNGRVGEVKRVQVGTPASVAASNYPVMPVPDWLDYDTWLGPAPQAPYTENRIINSFWWHNSDYALGFVAGWGIHHVDIAQWGLGLDDTGPVAVEGVGVYPKEGMCDCATEYDVHLTYANGIDVHFTDNAKNPQGVLFQGTEGEVFVRRGFIDAKPKSLLTSSIGADEIHLTRSDDHVGNFLDCIRSRAKTVCPIETAVRSDTLCHISDIAMRLERPLQWDPQAEKFIGDDDANRRLVRAMRSPWRL